MNNTALPMRPGCNVCTLSPISLHPSDLELIKQAAFLAGYSIEEFVKLSAYLHSMELLNSVSRYVSPKLYTGASNDGLSAS